MTWWETVAFLAGALGLNQLIVSIAGHLLGRPSRRLDMAEKAQKIAAAAVDDLEEQRDRARAEAHEARQILIALLAHKITPEQARQRAHQAGII